MKPFDNAWTVIKMPQMQVTPEDYDEFGERFRMNRLDQILEQDPAQNLTGVNVPQREGLRQNMYMPMETDVPLSGDTLRQLRDEGFTVTNRVLPDESFSTNPSGRQYGFRTKANPISYGDRTGNLGTDIDQRSMQPLDLEGQSESRAALARRGGFDADNPFADDNYYEPRPESVRPEREQLMRLLHGASDEQIQSILDADQARTARAIGATRGMRGGKYGSEFARRQAEDLFEEKVAGPDREAREAEREAERQASIVTAAKMRQEMARAAEQRRAESQAKREEEEKRLRAQRKANRIPIPSSKVEPGTRNQVRRRPVRVKQKRRFGTTRGRPR